MLETYTFDFLKKLQLNNNREWFLEHRKEYEMAKENFIEFCDQLLQMLTSIQGNLSHTQVKDCILRINRDIRFSKDKRPYKGYFAAGFGPGGRSSGLVDFYLQIQPGSSFLGAGMWQPTSENLAAFRQEIDYNPEDLKKIIYNKKFKQRFPVIHGEKLKTKPRGYPIDHPDIELLRYKELFFTTRYRDLDLTNKDALKIVFDDCKILKPYQDYLNGIFFE